MPKNKADYIIALKYRFNISTDSVLYHEWINSICNKLIASVIMFILLVSGVPVVNGIIIYAVSFLVYDVLGIGINYVVGCFYKYQYSADVNKIMKNFISADKEEKEKILSGLETKKKNLSKTKLTQKGCELCTLCELSEDCKRKKCKDCDNSDYSMEYRKIMHEINLCNEKLNEYKQKQKEEEENLVAKENPDLLNAITKLEQIKTKSDLCPKELRKQYNKIVVLAENFIEKVKINPGLSDKLNKTFNIYFRELLLLFDTYNELQEEDDNKEFMDAIKAVLDKFEIYIKNVQDATRSEQKMQFKINSNLLEEALKNDIKKN